MRERIGNFLTGAGLGAILARGWRMTQGQETAAIPFDFHAGEVSLPAGIYSVVRMNGKGALQLRNKETGAVLPLIAPVRETRREEARLAFDRFGDHYFLSAVWAPGRAENPVRQNSMENRRGEKLTITSVPLLRGRAQAR